MHYEIPAAVCVVLAATASAQVAAPPVHRTDVAAVTFSDDVVVRLREGRVSDLGAGTLDGVKELMAELEAKGCRWERAYPEHTEARLDEMHATAERYWGRGIANLNNQFNLWVPAGEDLWKLCARLEAAGVVQRAEPHLTGIGNDPLPPNFVPNQHYFAANPSGINNSDVSTWPGGRGPGVVVVDVERQWNVSHAEFAGRMLRAGPGTSGDPAASSNDHGTAVMGILVSQSGTWGTTGSVPDAQPYYAHVYLAGLYNVAQATVNAASVTGPGGVILIEQHMIGPASNYVPMEWRLDCYNAIRTAVGNGITVCEAAGNGNQNLDAAIYQTGNGGHYPFKLENDSGAIMVGAGGAAVGGSVVARSRLTFSNYGQTVDLQGWGESVFTIAYGDAYNSEGVNYRYTSGFSGTSSATPIVSSAAAQLLGVYRAVKGRWLTPAEVKQHLRATGTPQQAGTNPLTQNIGPQPNTRAAVVAALASPDCNSNNRPDVIDVAMGVADVNGNGVPDTCEPPPCSADYNHDGAVGTDADIEDFFRCLAGDCCAACTSADFNGDGDVATDADIEAFFRVLAGGPC